MNTNFSMPSRSNVVQTNIFKKKILMNYECNMKYLYL